jgi:hypothetical protein
MDNRGKRAQKRGKNISLISALSVKDVLASANIYGAVYGATLEAFVALKLIPKLSSGKMPVLSWIMPKSILGKW